MLEALFLTAKSATLLSCAIYGIIQCYKAVRVEPMCDSCVHLRMKGGGYSKYQCDYNGLQYYDQAPELCRAYRKREEKRNDPL